MTGEYKVGNVSMTPENESDIRSHLHPTSVPVNGSAVMDFCKDIVDMAVDLKGVSSASRAALIREIKGKLHGIVYAFVGDKVFKDSNKKGEVDEY